MGMLVEGYENGRGVGMPSPLGAGSRVFEGAGAPADGNGKKSGTIFAGSLNLTDRLAERREKGQKQAMKIVADALAKDVKLDGREQQMRDRIKELTSEIRDSREEVKAYQEELDTVKREYGISEEEEKELQPGLDLLRKRDRDGLTEGEKERLASYNMEKLESFYHAKEHLRQAEKDLDNRQTQLRANVSGLTAMRIERLKTHEMADARAEKDELLDELDAELLGMVVGGAVDKIDADLEERVKEAKEQKEEKEEDEEKLEKTAEHREEIEAFADRVQTRADRMEAESRRIRRMTEEVLEGEASNEKLVTEAASLDTMGDASSMAMAEIRAKVAAAGKSAEPVTADAASSQEALKEIEAMMDRLKLLGEDMKGAAVDELL